MAAVSVRHGMARGLFSNESGMGSAPIVAAAAKTKNSVRQTLISSTGTFWSTVVICAITGIVLVSSIMAQQGAVDLNSINGAILTHIAFCQIKYVGPVILTFGLIICFYHHVGLVILWREMHGISFWDKI
jgi:AGCS family alanine or glycine:cation symporter